MEEYDEFEMGVRDDLEFDPDDQHNVDSSDGVLLHDEVTQLDSDDEHDERRSPPHRRRISEISDPLEHVDGFDDGDGESDQNADDDDAEVSDPFQPRLVPQTQHALFMAGRPQFAIQVMALAAMLTVGVRETVAGT